MVAEKCYRRFHLSTSAAIAIVLVVASSGFIGNARAQELKTDIVPADVPSSKSAVNAQPQEVSHSSVNLEKDKASTVQHHHYNSPAERAEDALCITQVKAALADDDISNDYPVEVDCDHGTIRLTGVVGSADEAKEAEQIALQTDGVVGVKNNLTWR